METAQKLAAPALFGMVVRERRRVALLAKTASSLDERLLQEQKQRDQSEANLRALRDESNSEIAELEQKHQEHILSLMQMVTTSAEHAAENGSFYPSDNDVSTETEYRFQKQLLVLAGERVGALECQVNDLQSENTVREEYMERLEDTTRRLDDKTRECEMFEQTRNDLRSVLRQVRQLISDFSSDDTRLNNLRNSVIDAIDGVLHSDSSHSQRLADSRISAGSDRITSPKLMRRFEVMDSSESEFEDEEDGGEPEWAARIMADLDLIVKGQVPPSLNSSTTHTVDGSEQDSVFDRLANPMSFTGTQKRQGRRKLRQGSAPTSARHIPDDGGKTEHVANDLLLRSPSDEQDEHETQASGEQEQEEQSQHPASVFDRLCSPSHFTGTQKGKFKESKAKRDRAADVTAERVLDGLLEENVGVGVSTEATQNKSPNPDLYEYSKSNVFDRLQKRTTHAAALRQSERLYVDGNKQTHVSRKINQSDPHVHSDLPDSSTEQVGSEYSMKHVAIRQQRSATQTNSVRQVVTSSDGRLASETTVNEGSKRSLHLESNVDSRQSHDNYTKQNVFERLTKTTTEAFEQKLNR